MTAPALLWFRQDLRLADNPALAAALQHGGQQLPVYILDSVHPGKWQPGGASRWWLHHSLMQLDAALRARGSRLILRRGDPAVILPELARTVGATAVMWNRCYEPWAVTRDEQIKRSLKESGLAVTSFNGSLLREPWDIQKPDGAPYRVFTPYWKALQKLEIPAPLPAPAALPSCPDVASDSLDSWTLCPTRPDWAGGLRDSWQPGEAGALQRWTDFAERALGGYGELRNRPDLPATSALSPHLHFGEISPRTLWHQTQARLAAQPQLHRDSEKFLAEMGWREFSYNLLWQCPDLPDVPLRPEFRAFPWADDPAALSGWQRGETGYPIVDAGMKQLWHTGWMHNRVRMIVASFLVKDLLIPWQAGAAWFWDTLVDADLASNAASWQWVAGCGADAAPYFRVFNPVLQGEKFDPDGTYVRRWLPELATVPSAFIHKPWQAPPLLRPRHYPAPMVAHDMARDRALAAFAEIKAEKP
jgi:deoxyribodipyrimidine photo-lyase